jgi:ribonuclease PH
MVEPDGFIEVQGTAEREPFRGDELTRLLALARSGIGELFNAQRKALAEPRAEAGAR